MKGNVALEFVLLLLVALVFIIGANYRLYLTVDQTIREISKVYVARKSVDTIKLVADMLLSSADGSMYPVYVHIPADTILTLSGNSIVAEMNLEENLDYLPMCTGNTCTIVEHIDGNFDNTYAWTGSASLYIILINEGNRRLGVK